MRDGEMGRWMGDGWGGGRMAEEMVGEVGVEMDGRMVKGWRDRCGNGWGDGGRDEGWLRIGWTWMDRGINRWGMDREMKGGMVGEIVEGMM